MRAVRNQDMSQEPRYWWRRSALAVAAFVWMFSAGFDVSLVAQAAVDDELDAAAKAFWAAVTDNERARAIEGILALRPDSDEVLTALRSGRAYTTDVPTGRHILSRQNRNGREHAYVLHVPDSYDPARRYSVRFYLHGGVMRAKQLDGNWWPNDVGMARDDSLVLFPASWEGSLWWQTSQIENLSGLLNDLKRVYNIDENRVHLLGISDGATGAYYHAFKATTPWAGFLPFNGHPVVLGNSASDVAGEMHVTNLRAKPFFVINGVLDRLYPAESVERYVRLFLSAGIYADFRPQVDAGHDMRWWSRETASIDSFVEGTPRRPLPNRLTWETETTDMFNRAHWLRIDELGTVEGESSLEDFNALTSRVQRTPLGINMLGELESRPGLRIFDIGPSSIAELSGIELNDIILEIDGVPTSNVGSFRKAIIEFSPGDRMPVTIEREGKRLELSLDYPADPSEGARPAFPHRLSSGRVDLERRDNTITVSTEGVRAYTLFLSPDQFDFSHPITVVTNEVLSHKGFVRPDVATMLRWAAIDQDRTLLFAAELRIEVVPTP